MSIRYTKTDQGRTISTGTGAPVHAAVSGDEYTDQTTGVEWRYDTSWEDISLGSIVGISGTKAEFNTACSDENFVYQSDFRTDFSVIDDNGIPTIKAVNDKLLTLSTVNGGSGVDFYIDDTASDISTYSTLNRSPENVAETVLSATANNGRTLIKSLASASGGLGGTQIDAGEWIFDAFAYVDVIGVGFSSIDIDVYKRTSGGTETLLFNANSGTISATTELYSIKSIQQAFAINSTDRLVVKYYAKTTAVINRTCSLLYGGSDHYSNFSTPLVQRLQDLAGVIALTSQVSGALPIANGGTGQTTAIPAFNALSPLTTLGDSLYNDGTNDVRLPGNITTGIKFLSQIGDGSNSTAPVWSTMPSAGLSSYFFYKTVSDIGGYYQMTQAGTAGAGQTIVSGSLANSTNTILASFATNSGFPNLQFIPSGVVTVYVTASQNTSAGETIQLFAEYYVRTSGGTETLVATTGLSNILTTSSVAYIFQGNIPTGLITNLTDRVVVKVRAQTGSSGGSHTVTLTIEDNTSARSELPANTVDASNFIPYSGATANIDFNSKVLSSAVFGLANNTFTATLAQLNTAVTDADLMKLGTNVVVVNDWTTDLPAIVSGNITLADNKTYIIRGSQNTSTNTITFGISNVVLGWDRSSDQLIYTGTSTQLINSNKDCTISNLTLAAVTAGGSVFNFTGSTNKIVIDKIVFGSCKSLGTISGGDVLVFNENIVTLCTVGLVISGTYNFSEVTDTLWEANSSTITCLSVPSGTFGQLKVSRNIFNVATTQTAISIGTPTVTLAVIEACDFAGTGTFITGVNNLTPNWLIRLNRDTTSTVKNSIIYQPRVLERSWFQVRASNATRVSVGTTSTGFGTGSNTTDSVSGLTKFATAATAGSFAGLESTAFTELPIDSNAIFSAVIKTDTDISNQRLWIGLQSATLLDADNQSGSGVSFRYSTVAGDTGWRAIVDDATTQTVSSNIGTVAVSTYYYLELRVDFANTKSYFQVNNGGWTTVSAVPVTGTKMGWVCEMTNPATGARAFHFSRLDCNHL